MCWPGAYVSLEEKREGGETRRFRILDRLVEDEGERRMSRNGLYVTSASNCRIPSLVPGIWKLECLYILSC